MLTLYRNSKLNDCNTSQQTLDLAQEQSNENSLQKIDDITSGKYDTTILFTSTEPKISSELQTLIKIHNREFVERLFAKCASKQQLDFWLGKGHVQLPKDALALAVALGCNKAVFECLKEKGVLSSLCIEDKSEFMSRAKRFQNSDGYAYLLAEFDRMAQITIKSAILELS